MSRKSLLKERHRYEVLTEDVFSLAAAVGVMLVILAYLELAERQADILLAIYLVTVCIGVALSHSKKIANAGVVAISMIALLLKLGITSLPMLLLHGVSGVKKYWKVQIRYYFKVISVR